MKQCFCFSSTAVAALKANCVVIIMNMTSSGEPPSTAAASTNAAEGEDGAQSPEHDDGGDDAMDDENKTEEAGLPDPKLLPRRPTSEQILQLMFDPTHADHEKSIWQFFLKQSPEIPPFDEFVNRVEKKDPSKGA